MTTMLERAARAAGEAVSGVLCTPDRIAVVRAVLMAVREPDAETQLEAWLFAPDEDYSDFQRAADFTAMIDAILNDPSQ